MSCTNPMYALDLGIKENGKRNIKILPVRADLSSLHQLEYRYGKGNILPLPCGKCLACRLSKAREWAVRCTLEASLYDDNSFVTLTYDDEHLPNDLKVHRKEVSNFIRRLRKEGIEVRYFGCGEYGSHTKRPHYHLILFGWYPDDVKHGSSKLLQKLWPYGFNYVTECCFETCQYVARYTTKKIFGSDNGEFLTMSLRPGIGAGWFEKHTEIFDHDSIYGSFGVSNIPRYFEKLAVASGMDLTSLKDERISKATDIKLYEMFLHSLDKIEKLYDYKNDINIAEYKRKGERKDL